MTPEPSSAIDTAQKMDKKKVNSTISATLLGITVSEDESSRRSSFSLPLSTVIFPRSSQDYRDSTRLTKQMEEKYGFHYLTNSFCLNTLAEMEYQAYFIQTNLKPACFAAVGCWVALFAYIMHNIVLIYYEDGPRRLLAISNIILSCIIVILPVPILLSLCRAKRFSGYEPIYLCAIMHCFVLAEIAHSLLPLCGFHNQIFLEDFNYIAEFISSKNPIGLQNISQVIHLGNETTWWKYRNYTGTTPSLIPFYLAKVVLPSVERTYSLLRPLVLLAIAPLLKLSPYHYMITSMTVNIGFIYTSVLMFPESHSVQTEVEKFLSLLTLSSVTVILNFRMRQTDRFLRLNFLHAKLVEEKARATLLQKQIIISENKSLKQIVGQKNESTTKTMDLDSPMTKVIADLKNLHQHASLSPELKENLDGIIHVLTEKGQDLFSPDIYEQLQHARGSDMDRDTKSWATTVLSNISYTRTRPSAASYPALPSKNSLYRGPDQYNESRLHPDVSILEEDLMVTVAALIDRDGWNADLQHIASITGNRPISFITYVAFEQHDLFQLCSVDKTILINFLWFVDNGYFRNPYHNNTHGADVVNSVEHIIAVLDNGYIQELLNYQEIFAALIAATIHDFRHPGKSNYFMTKNGSDLAILYSDCSVLEHMHLAEAFFLVKDPACNIFSGLAPGSYAEVRKAIIEIVLSTDLSMHLQVVQALKAAAISRETTEVIHSPIMIMKAVIKCADLGHSAKVGRLHARWSDYIIEEFFLQGDDEHLLGLDISPFMNRANENSAKNQIGFFEFIVLPFFEVLAEVMFKVEFKTILDQAHQNYRLWKKAESLQLNSIKDILDQVFVVNPSRS